MLFTHCYLTLCKNEIDNQHYLYVITDENKIWHAQEVNSNVFFKFDVHYYNLFWNSTLLSGANTNACYVFGFDNPDLNTLEITKTILCKALFESNQKDFSKEISAEDKEFVECNVVLDNEDFHDLENSIEVTKSD